MKLAKVIPITVMKCKESSSTNVVLEAMKEAGLPLTKATYLALNDQSEDNVEEPIPEELGQVKKPTRLKTHGIIEDLAQPFCESIERLSEKEKAELRQTLIKDEGIPPSLRWIN